MAKRRKANPDDPPLECDIRDKIVQMLRDRDWVAEVTHGNQFQHGLPDILAGCPWRGHRWIDVKRPGKNSLTQSQRAKWPRWFKQGLGVWILEAADEENYARLNSPPNWQKFWKKSYGDPFLFEQIPNMLEALNHAKN